MATRTLRTPSILLMSDTSGVRMANSPSKPGPTCSSRDLSGDVLREHVVWLLLGSRRLLHQSSHHQHERVSVVRGAANRQRSQAASFSQTCTSVPVSQSNGNVDGSVDGNAHPVHHRRCPQCRGLLEYREKWPALSAVDPDRREPLDRLRYVSGWFCSDPACEYQELAQSRKSG